jgi:hypothetical protein
MEREVEVWQATLTGAICVLLLNLAQSTSTVLSS